jgi:hypothetical protein
MNTNTWTGVVALSIGLSATLAQAGQARRQPNQGAQGVTVSASLKIGGDSYNSSTSGSCTHAPQASIYDVPSEMWMVRQEADGRAIQLTFWHPTNGTADMFGFSARGKKGLQVSTVRGGPISGSGTVTLQRSGKGGTFTIDARTAAGEVITGTIRCDAFTAAVAEGG